MKEELVNKAYEIAKERYAETGVDTEKVMEQMQNFHLSLHCWQTDDVIGFENLTGSLSGGIATTGNYPGRARNTGGDNKTETDYRRCDTAHERLLSGDRGYFSEGAEARSSFRHAITEAQSLVHLPEKGKCRKGCGLCRAHGVP